MLSNVILCDLTYFVFLPKGVAWLMYYGGYSHREDKNGKMVLLLSLVSFIYIKCSLSFFLNCC